MSRFLFEASDPLALALTLTLAMGIVDGVDCADVHSVAQVATKNRAYDRGPDRVSFLVHVLSVADEERFDWLAVLPEKPFSDVDEV